MAGVTGEDRPKIAFRAGDEERRQIVIHRTPFGATVGGETCLALAALHQCGPAILECFDRDTYQWVRVEARVTRPVRIDGFLAEVQPGTHFELEKMPVSNEVWLPKHFAMKSDAKVMFFFSHHEQEDDTYSDYHKATNSQSRQAPDAAQNVGPSQ